MVRRKIETTSHYSRDVTFGEDKSRIRSNPGVFARLRSFAFNILKSSETSTLCQDRYRAALAGIDNLLEILAIPSGITEGPISRPVLKGSRLQTVTLTPHSAAQIVKAYAKRAGLDPSSFSGHSLRAGFLTSAAESGAAIFKMMDQSRHKSVDTLRSYVR